MIKRCAEREGLPVLAAPTYGSMIKAYGQAGNVEQVWALWSEMEERGVKPTAIAFGCTVDSLMNNGGVHDAWNHLPSACQHCYILRSSRVLQYRSRRNASSQFMLRCVWVECSVIIRRTTPGSRLALVVAAWIKSQHCSDG